MIDLITEVRLRTRSQPVLGYVTQENAMCWIGGCMTAPTYSTLTIRLSEAQHAELERHAAEVAAWAGMEISARDAAEGIIVAALVARQVERAAELARAEG